MLDSNSSIDYNNSIDNNNNNIVNDMIRGLNSHSVNSISK